MGLSILFLTFQSLADTASASSIQYLNVSIQKSGFFVTIKEIKGVARIHFLASGPEMRDFCSEQGRTRVYAEAYNAYATLGEHSFSPPPLTKGNQGGNFLLKQSLVFKLAD